MNQPVSITTERVDDIPLLLALLERMGVAALLDEHFPQHGNWQGVSLGTVVVVWLSHILSQADHRLNQVQAWVEHHLETIGGILGQEIRALDWSDLRVRSSDQTTAAQILRGICAAGMEERIRNFSNNRYIESDFQWFNPPTTQDPVVGLQTRLKVWLT